MEPEEYQDDMPCCVCDEPIGMKDVTCEICYQPFHWNGCGGWTWSNRKACDNCREPEDRKS